MKRTRFTRTLSMLLVVMMMMTMMPANVGTAKKNDSGDIGSSATETVILDVLNNSAGDIIVNGTTYTHGTVLTFNVGDIILIKSAPKEGNIFKQWNFPWARGNDKFIYEDPYEFVIMEDTAIRIKFQRGDATTYTVTFDPGEHGQIETPIIRIQEVEQGQPAEDPGIIANDGYNFDGWDKDFSNVQSDMTVTAQYSIKQYTVTFDPGIGSFTGERDTITQSVNHGGTAVTPDDSEVVAPIGHTFNGEWSPSDLTNITGDKTFTAQFDKNEYTVTFDSNEGSAVEDVKALYDTLIDEPTEPTKTGYDFAGWFKDQGLTDSWDFETDKVTEDTTLFAKWNGSSGTGYKVEHYLEDLGGVGYSLQETENLSGTTGQTANATAKDYDGFTYDSGVQGTNSSGTISADGSLTLKLFYSRNDYTVSFDADGGTPEPDDQALDFGSLVTEPSAPSKEGHAFDGWFNGDEPWDFDEDTVPAEDITLTAKYTINEYTVTFDPGDNGVLENDELGTQTIAHGSGASDPGVVADTGYTFTGWSPASMDNITGTTTFTAQYQLNEYTVTFDPGDNGVLENDELGTQTIAHGSGASDPGVVADTGYIFTGWSGSFDNITGNITLTAQYELQTVTATITESLGGTTTVRTVTYSYGDLATAENLGIEDIDGYTYEVDVDIPFNITEDTSINVSYTIIPADETEEDEEEIPVAPVQTAPDAPEPVDPEPQADPTPPAATGTPTLAATNEPAGAENEVLVDEEPVPEASQEPEDVVAIDDEEVAQAPLDDVFNFWWLLLLLLPFLFFLLWRNRVIPVLEGVSDNNDGTYTVTWGYNNRKIKKVEFDKEDSEINVLAGNILRGEEPPIEFEKGRHENVFKTIVNKDAKIEWNIKRKKALADVVEQLKK